MAIAVPISSCEPPKYVEYSRRFPEGLSFATKASPNTVNDNPPEPPKCDWNGFPATGKSNETVNPVIYASPAESTASPKATSSAAPPKYVMYTSVPEGLNFAT